MRKSPPYIISDSMLLNLPDLPVICCNPLWSHHVVWKSFGTQRSRSSVGRGQMRSTARLYIPVTVVIVTTCTTPSDPGCKPVILANDQHSGGILSSRRTTVPICKRFNGWRLANVYSCVRFCLIHRCQ